MRQYLLMYPACSNYKKTMRSPHAEIPWIYTQFQTSHHRCGVYTSLLSHLYPPQQHRMNISSIGDSTGSNADDIWHRHESEIRHLYQTKGLNEMKDVMEVEYGFPKLA